MILLGLALVGGFLGVLLLLIGAVEPDEGARKEPDEEWSAPLLARAERPPGQGPRTRDLRADEPAADEPADDSQG